MWVELRSVEAGQVYMLLILHKGLELLEGRP